MYSEKFATAIKVAGKVLRESGETVALPFGAEYSIHLKNMNSVRALVKVEIDGVDVTQGTELVVAANGFIDLERFITSNPADKGHKLKFIERSAKIENGPRGIRAEDGLVRIQFEFERPATPTIWSNQLHGSYNSTYTGDHQYIAKSAMRGLSSNSDREILCSSGVASSTSAPVQISNAGITVQGAVSNQQFHAVTRPMTDGVKHVMIMKLVGRIGEDVVMTPITVKTKQECPTCGTMNKHGTKFCKECGTGLTVL